MSFPETRPSLIGRLAGGSNEDDWRRFLTDYWRPLCRFAARWGKLSLPDAEDIAAVTLQAILQNRLFARWVDDRRAKLRTLICAVARNLIANSQRDLANRSRLERTNRDSLLRLASAMVDEAPATSSEEEDAFYSAWVEDLLDASLDQLVDEYHDSGRGDYVRVLCGKVCEQSTLREIAESLGIKLTDAENYLRHARNRLSEIVKLQTLRQIERYADDATAEFDEEWNRLGRFLAEHGGLDEALRRTYVDFDTDAVKRHESTSVTGILRSLE